MATKVIKLQNNSYTLLPATDANVVQFSYNNETKSVHAAIISLSDRINNIENSSEIDPVFSASPSAGITNNDISYWNSKQPALVFDDIPTMNSDNPVVSNGIYNAIKDVENYIPIEYADLTDLRDTDKLIAGAWYRITNYVTACEDNNTDVAYHRFDILVLATSESTLSEEAKAIEHDGDTYFSNNNCNLDAWKLWYCLDNDTDRFAWADINGTGVIYRMIDEWGNDCPYDFKNILFKRKVDCGELNANGANFYLYTFTAYDNEDDTYYDASVICYKEIIDDNSNECRNNIIKPYFSEEACDLCPQLLNNNVFLNYYDNVDEDVYYECKYNILDYNCSNNTFGNYCCNNTFGNDCSGNTFGNVYSQNIFGNNCYNNKFGNDCYNNTFGNNCLNNTFGNNCYQNIFGNDCYYNTFGNNCSQNIFENICEHNILGDNCDYNTFGNNCYYIKFGTSNTVKSYVRYITVENNCHRVYLTTSVTTSSSNYLQNIILLGDVNISTNSSYITIWHPTVNDRYITKYNERKSYIKETTWQNLVDLRDNDALIHGMWYRITDYVTTSADNFVNVADHLFDVIVFATSENTLSEEARAIEHYGESYFSDNNCNLDAWKIWYCLDNDTTRFEWADTTNGKGVIYRMIDEHGNDCPYDFKNIQFQRKLTDGVLDNTNGTNTWVYTFTVYDEDNDEYNDASVIYAYDEDNDACNYCYNNIIKNNYDIIGENYVQRLNKNVFLNIYNFNNDIYYHCMNNIFGNNCSGNTFGNNCYNNTFGNYCNNNKFGNYCINNTFGNDCKQNTFENDCNGNTFGNDCRQNTFGNNCYYNTFGQFCLNNIFGNSCQYNIFEKYCTNNIFGNSCQYNIFKIVCTYIKFGDSSSTKSYVMYITIDESCSYIYLSTSATTSSSNWLRNITLGKRIRGTSSNRKVILHPTVNDTFETKYVAENSKTISI